MTSHSSRLARPRARSTPIHRSDSLPRARSRPRRARRPSLTRIFTLPSRSRVSGRLFRALIARARRSRVRTARDERIERFLRTPAAGVRTRSPASSASTVSRARVSRLDPRGERARRWARVVQCSERHQCVIRGIFVARRRVMVDGRASSVPRARGDFITFARAAGGARAAIGWTATRARGRSRSRRGCPRPSPRVERAIAETSTTAVWDEASARGRG